MTGSERPDLHVTLRPASPADCRQVWEWRNESATRLASFHTEEIPYPEHEQWFANRLADGRTRLFIVRDPHGTDVGYVRFDRTDMGIELSISLDRRFRGLGYGREAIRKGAATIIAAGAPCVIARIKSGNPASVAAFTAAGFERRRIANVGGVEALEMIYPPGACV